MANFVSFQIIIGVSFFFKKFPDSLTNRLTYQNLNFSSHVRSLENNGNYRCVWNFWAEISSINLKKSKIHKSSLHIERV